MRPAIPILLFVAVVPTVLAGCGSQHRLAEYPFADASLGIESFFQAQPSVLTSAYSAEYQGDPVSQVLSTGGQIARDVTARSVAEKLDSAAVIVDVKTRIADRTLDRSARYLGATPVPDPETAVYLLELVMHDYGIDARQWEDAAYVFIDAEVTLIDAPTGQEIWSARVTRRDPITPILEGGATPTRDVVTAAALADTSVEDLVPALERISDYCADLITDRLRSDLRDLEG